MLRQILGVQREGLSGTALPPSIMSTTYRPLAHLSLTLAGCLALGACDKNATETPTEPRAEPTALETQVADGPWTEVEHYCASLEAEACEPNEVIFGMLSDHREIAAAAGNLIELSTVVSQTGGTQVAHLLLHRADEGHWALPVAELEAGASLDDQSLRIMRADTPEHNANLVQISVVHTRKQQAEIWDMRETTYVCQVDPEGPVSCASFVSIRAQVDEATNDELPYLEALFVPVAERPGEFEVMRMKQNGGAETYGEEVLAEGVYRLVEP